MPPMKMGPSQKPKSFKKAWGKIISNNKRIILPTVIAILFACASSVLTIIGPKQLGKITNIITDSFKMGFVPISTTKVEKIFITLAIIYGTAAILSYLQGFIMSTIAQRMAQRLRKQIAQKINRLPLSYMDKTTYGDVLSRVTNDVDIMSESLSQSTVQLVSSITMFLGSLVMMFVTNYIMAFSAVGSTVLGFVAMFLIMRRSQKYFVQQQKQLGELNGQIEEVYSGHSIISVYNAKEQTNRAFEKQNKTLYTSAWKSQFFSGIMMPIMGFIGNFGYVVVCVVGAALTMGGHIGFGVIVSFMLYVRFFTQPLSQIAQSLTSLQSTAAASERVFEFLEAPEMESEEDKTQSLDSVLGNVVFDHVKFGYEPNKEIIHDFSCNIQAGQKVAIVGPTGAGKTTLVNLLMRFYEPWSGKILIDGMPIADITRENVHKLFGMVLQDTWLYEGTIAENIVFNQPNLSRADVVAAAKTAGLHHFIKTLPNGYDTVLNDNTTISQGQRQLLTIARAFAQNAPMLILDEATSSVDTRTEVLIQQAMDKLTKNRTSFVIAHRLSTIKNSDLILVLNNGDIVEQGTHQELLDKGGAYALLYNSQFEEE